MAKDDQELLVRYKFYRDEDRHECTLLSARVTGLLTSQSIFAAIIALIYQAPSGGPIPRPVVVMLIAALAYCMAYLGCVAICLGILVLRAWHKLGRKFEAVDTNHVLEGYHLRRQELPGVDRFNIGLPICFGVAWTTLIVVNLVIFTAQIWNTPWYWVPFFVFAVLAAFAIRGIRHLRSIWKKGEGSMVPDFQPRKDHWITPS